LKATRKFKRGIAGGAVGVFGIYFKSQIFTPRVVRKPKGIVCIQRYIVLLRFKLKGLVDLLKADYNIPLKR
jgi:hypothetical protein